MTPDSGSVEVGKQLRDPFQLEVIKNALEGIADGMALTIVRTSRSSVVRSSLDFSTAVMDRNGQLVGQGMCQALHLGGMMPALEACLRQYSDDIHPGDILINNDPYEGGSHLPDIFLYKPIFHGGVLAAYGCAMAHQTDIGGRVAGGNACDSTEIYQEGLRIPPLKLFDMGRPNDTLFRILQKAVRVPESVLGDVRSQIAALNYAERELINLIDRYGLDTILAIGDELLEYTERMTRKALRALPNGSWNFTDYVDDDGIVNEPIPIVVTLTKRDDELHVDFTGTGPQCKGAIQPVLATTKAMVYSALKNVLGLVSDSIPNTSGYFRPVSVTAPIGTFVNPLPPAAVAARALGCIRIHQALMGAFAQMLPDKIYACTGGCEYGASFSGYDHSQSPPRAWIQLEFLLESAVGGYSYRDGEDAQQGGQANAALIPVETIELEQPIRIEEFALLPDSEGAGKYRGGLGIVRRYRFLSDDTQIQMRSDRTHHGPYGLFGGESAGTTKITIMRSGNVTLMPSKFIEHLDSGSVMEAKVPGAGGWGNPLERDPRLVWKDIIEEKVSQRRARTKYGVVLDDRRTVDWAATERLRLQLSAKRRRPGRPSLLRTSRGHESTSPDGGNTAPPSSLVNRAVSDIPIPTVAGTKRVH